jgi:adenosylmethionine-8-amino-7-oxononanoate aminotransferase
VIELSAKIAELAPGDLNRTFFCSGGSEANDSIIKLVRQYHQIGGEHHRYKMIARRTAYHGTTLGALSLTGISSIKAPFEPLLPGVRHVSNTNSYRRPEGETEAEFTAFLLDELRGVIEQEGPHSVAAVFMEPVQNSGGTFTPPEGYFQGVRAICDEYGILLVADEVICGYGRLGHWFGSERYDIRPDIITFAKGIGSAHVPLGGVLMTDRIADPFVTGSHMFTHGITYGGHPVATAVALKNLEVMEREDVLGNVRRNEPYFRGVLEKLGEKPIVGDVRGAGYFMSLELVRDKETKETFSDEECDRLLRGFLSPRLYEAGLICRADDRGDPVIQLSPPLIATREDLDFVHDVLDTVLDDAWTEMTRSRGRAAVTS